MKRQIEVIRTMIAVMLAAVALALVVFTLATAAPSTHPQILPTLTAPSPLDSYPAPYPPPVDSYPAPYPAYLPFVQDGESYP